MLMFEWLKKENPKKDIDSETYELPSFPDFPTQKEFAQTAIKDAVTDSKTFLPKFPPMVPKKPEETHAPQPFPIPTLPQFSAQPKLLPRENPNADIFVKIEKFHASQKALENTKEKIEEMERQLKKLRELTAREEIQLSSWERDIEAIKYKIKEISKNMFEKQE